MKNKALSYMFRTAKKEFFKLFALTLLNIVTAGLSVYFALAMRNVINRASEGNVQETKTAAVILVAVVAVQIALLVISRIFEAHITARLEIRFRENAFSKILTRDYSEISGFHSGEIQNRLFNDVNVVSENTATLIPQTLGLIARLLGAFIAIFRTDMQFALIILCGGAVILVSARLLRGVMKKTHKSVQEAGGKLRSFIQESIENILVIKAFKMEEKISETADEKSEEHYGKKMLRALFATGTSAGFSTLVMCGYLYAVIWGAVKILTGTAGFGYGDFVALIQLINQIQTPFAQLSGSLSRYYAAIASAERIMELENLSGDTAEKTGDTEVLYSELRGIEISHLSFAYGDTKVFDDASIIIPKGELTLISGISGIGKSTLIKLLMGVLKPREGSITALLASGEKRIDSSMRGLFAYVPQGNLLMSGTIRDNMLLARKDVSDAEICDALDIACADFVKKLDGGINFTIGERGSGLSEGQVQRLAIARAILSKNPILLLDEATSALDEPTERRVLENIMNLEGKTCVAISHRSGARRVCGQEICIEDGKIFKI